MSEDRRRRLRGGAGPGRTRRVGEPNVLSDAAVPNRLSGLAAPSSAPSPSVSRLPVQTARPGDAGSPSTEPPEGWLSSGQTAARPRVRLSLSTLLFLGFLALTLFRALGELIDDRSGQDPGQTTAPLGSFAVSPGLVTFGTGPAGDCTVVGAAVTFSPGTDVWWSAEMATEQDAKADALVIVLRDSSEVQREYIPADPSFGSWTTLCASDPIQESDAGRYRVEVWDGELRVLQSVGEYVLTR